MRKMLEVTFGGEDVILTNESQIKKIARDGFLEGAEFALRKFMTFTIKDAAEFIGVSPITMQKYIKSGDIKMSGNRVSGSSLIEFINGKHI